jgi:transposase
MPGKKILKQQIISPSPQFSSKRVGLFKDLLAENNVTTLQLPPYSPDLAPVPSTEISIERRALL